MLTQELVEFINSQVENALPRSEYLSQDYIELLDFLAEKLIANNIEIFSVKRGESYQSGSVSPLFGFITNYVHQAIIQQVTNTLDMALADWYTMKMYECCDNL